MYPTAPLMRVRIPSSGRSFFSRIRASRPGAPLCRTLLLCGLVFAFVAALAFTIPSGYVTSECYINVEQLADMYELFHRFILMTKAENVTWWADFGTLLGAVRQQEIIPWDKDLDVGIMRRDLWRIEQLVDKGLISSYGLRLHGGTIILSDRNTSVDDLEDLPSKLEIFEYTVRTDGRLQRHDLFKQEAAMESEAHASSTRLASERWGAARRFKLAVTSWFSDAGTSVADMLPLSAVKLRVPEAIRRHIATDKRNGGPQFPAELVFPAPRLPESHLHRLYGWTWRHAIKWKLRCYF